MMRMSERAILWMLIAIGVASLVVLAACSDSLHEAQSLEAQGDYEAAITIYETLLEARPDDAAAVSGLASNLMIMGRHDEALPWQEKALALNPKDAQTAVELGFNYLRHQQRPHDAVESFRAAVATEASSRNRCFLAQGLMVLDDYVAAEGELREAIESEPEYAYSYRLLIGLLEREGRGREIEETRALAESRGVPLEEEE